jgi:hypothetical protein
MAHSIVGAVRHIKDELHTHPTPADIHAACQASGHRWRECVLAGV